MIVVLDYGVGNVSAIANMVRRLGQSAIVSSNPTDVLRATHLILPGVGSFDHGARNLEAHGLVPLLHERVLRDKVPVLGICLGMQLMTQRSEEGVLPGLGWIPGATLRFDFGANPRRLTVPNMGWQPVQARCQDGIFRGYDSVPRFYFVHSYHCVPDHESHVLATSFYGYEYCCAVRRDNIWGVQFHPEKSHRFGMRLLNNFLQLGIQARAAAA